MNKANILEQDIKGKVQEFKGKVESATGENTRGAIDKLKGKSNQKIAEIKNKI